VTITITSFLGIHITYYDISLIITREIAAPELLLQLPSVRNKRRYFEFQKVGTTSTRTRSCNTNRTSILSWTKRKYLQ